MAARSAGELLHSLRKSSLDSWQLLAKYSIVRLSRLNILAEGRRVYTQHVAVVRAVHHVNCARTESLLAAKGPAVLVCAREMP